MAQDFVLALYRWFLSGVDVFRQLLWLILATAVALAAFWLLYKRLDSAEATEWRPNVLEALKKSLRAAAILVVLLLFCGSLVETRQLVENRRSTVEESMASHHKEPQLSGITQFAPAIGYMQERTYTRTLTLPPQFLNRIGSEGVQVLSPYLSDPSADDVLKLVDNFKRSGQDVVFTRQLTRMDQVPVPADSAEVHAAFQSHRTPSGQRYYDVAFDADYRFKNSQNAPANMRFNFPLPQGGGPVQEFYFQVGNQRVTEPDDHGLYVWTGSVSPSGAVTAHAHYVMTGGGAYDYALGSEQRRIGEFHMVASGAQQAKFGKSGIFPSSLTGSGAEWRLHDVLTMQNVNIVFPRSDTEGELFDKTLVLLPLVLVVFAVGAVVLVRRCVLPASVGFGLGLLGIPVLSAYVAPSVATLIGAALAVVAAGVVMRIPRGWFVSIVSGMLACAFLTTEHGGLFVWLVVLAAAAVTVVAKPKGTGRSLAAS